MHPRPPRSAGELEKLVRAEARTRGETETRLRRLISFEAIAGTLENAVASGIVDGYVVKGGASLALRYNPARTTKDLDIELPGTTEALYGMLDRALTVGLGLFRFVLHPGSPNEHGTLRTRVRVTYNTRDWSTVDVDIRAADPGATLDRVPLSALPRFAIAAPSSVRCLSAPSQIAQKIHAMTSPPRGATAKGRVHDLVDILKLRPQVVGRIDETRAECERVFRDRNTHPWPPIDPLPESWLPALPRLAAEAGLDMHPIAVVDTYYRLIAQIQGIKTMPNYQYRFIVLSAQQQIPNVLENAIDTTADGYGIFKRMTETEGWRLTHIFRYPSSDLTRAMLAILERPISEEDPGAPR